MENASKALIMAAEVLLGVLLLTLMVVIFQAADTFSGKIDDNIKTKQISEFNVQFEQYRGKDNLTAQDVITIRNLVNKSLQEGYEVKLSLENVESKYITSQSFLTGIYRDTDKENGKDNSDTFSFIQQYSNDSETKEIIYFECGKDDIEYNKETGRVEKITIKKL